MYSAILILLYRNYPDSNNEQRNEKGVYQGQQQQQQYPYEHQYSQGQQYPYEQQYSYNQYYGNNNSPNPYYIYNDSVYKSYH